MKRSAYTEARDQRIADDSIEDRSQMCPAHGCPCLWSVSGTRGKACSAHYFADRSEWPRITARLQDEETLRAIHRSQESPAEGLTQADKREILSRLRKLGKDPGSDRGWAEWLHAQHEAGAQLTRFQVEAYTRTMNLESRHRASHLPLPPGVRAN